MKLSLRLFAALAALCVFVAGGSAFGATTVTILHVNDTHSHLDAVGPKDANLDGTLGGLAKAASVITTLKQQNPNALFLHAGDFFQGDSYFNATLGTVELNTLSNLGLDAIVVGNHELVFGPLFLAGVIAATPPPGAPLFLSANLDISPLVALGFPQFLAPSVMKTVAGVQVGIFGLTLPQDGIERPGPAVLAGFPEILAIAQAQIDGLRAAGAQVVICLSHLGIDGDRKLANGVTGLDAIVGGHDHLAFEKPVFDGPPESQIPIVQAGEFYKNIGKLTLSVVDGAVTHVEYELVPVDEKWPRAFPLSDLQTAVNTRFQSFSGGLVTEDLFHVPVALALHDITRFYNPKFKDRDTGLGNLTADAIRDAGGPDTDVGITVSGFVEDEIAAGVVVGEDLFRPVCDGFDPFLLQPPFTGDPILPGFPGIGFPIVKFDLYGAEFLGVLETALTLGGDFFPQVSGMRFVLDSSRPALHRVKSVVIGGESLDPGRLYHFATNFGVLAGLEQLGLTPRNPTFVGTYEYVAMRSWAARLVLLDYRTEGRSRDVAPTHGRP
jgi:5'-nucleotidase / UDP-sugar diphosphatase